MAKKNILILGIAVIVILAATIFLSATIKDNKQNTNVNPALQAVEGMKVASVEGEEINVVNPGKAIDSSEIAPNQLELIPLNDEAVITYGADGSVTKTVRAKSGARVFLSFVAEDDMNHIFSFAEPEMESVLVAFSKAGGNVSINFLAPGPGTYNYLIDGVSAGTLIIE